MNTGQLLGTYEVRNLLGSGGMGEVYSAWDLNLKRQVAIKVLPEAFAQDTNRISRFQREAELLASLNHPHIAAIYDLQKVGGTHFLVMELINGETLAARIERGPIAVDEILTIALQIVGAVEAAHDKGIIHRDLKAANIMLTPAKQVKILDFGLARQLDFVEGDIATANTLNVAGVIAGTPQYLSPEVLQGARADARSDLWAVGVVLYEALAGRLPFNGKTLLEISSAILKDSTPSLPANVTPQLRAVVSRCLEKQPERRYSSASEIRADLEGLQSTGSRSDAVSRRRWLWSAAGAAAATVSGVAWWQMRTPPAKMLSTGGPPSSNPEANDLFELAMTLAGVQNNIPQALETFSRALAIDPKFSEARRAHAFYLVVHLLNGYTNDSNQLYLAEEELRQVASEAPDLVDLPSTQTALYVTLGRKELVPLAQLEQSHRENPLVAQTSIWRGILYLLAEQNKEAKDLFNDLLREQPNRGAARQLLGEVLRTEGDLEGAVRAELRVLEQAPTNISAIWILSTAYLDQGNLAAARTLLETKQPFFPGNYLWKHCWALLLAEEGKRDEAVQTMNEESLRFADVMFWATTLTADFYALLGDQAKAVDWLGKAVRNGDERINYFRKNPRLAAIRNDPRFQSIIRNVEARRTHAR